MSKKFEDAAMFVMENNTIEPEELGAILYDATRTPYYINTTYFDEDRRRVAQARKKLLNLKGGLELYEQQKRILGTLG